MNTKEDGVNRRRARGVSVNAEQDGVNRRRAASQSDRRARDAPVNTKQDGVNRRNVQLKKCRAPCTCEQAKTQIYTQISCCEQGRRRPPPQAPRYIQRSSS